MDDWQRKLSSAGYRRTAARTAILAVIQATRVPLTPQEVLARAQMTHVVLGLATVYRTLDLLSELVLIRRVHRENGCHGYLPCTPGHRHAVLCQQCGRAVEFEGTPDIKALIARVEAATGYRIDEHLLQLDGICPDCTAKEG